MFSITLNIMLFERYSTPLVLPQGRITEHLTYVSYSIKLPFELVAMQHYIGMFLQYQGVF